MVKEKESTNQSVLTTMLLNIKENVVGNTTRIIKEKIQRISKIGAELAIGFLFLSLSALFILLGLVFFVKEYLQMNYFVGFFCAGIIALIVSLISYYFIKKN